MVPYPTFLVAVPLTVLGLFVCFTSDPRCFWRVFESENPVRAGLASNYETRNTGTRPHAFNSDVGRTVGATL